MNVLINIAMSNGNIDYISFLMIGFERKFPN